MDNEAIKSALAGMATGDLLEKSKALLATLGYESQRDVELSGDVDDFIEEFPAENPGTKTEQEFRRHVESVQIIFQFTSDEIADSPQLEFLESTDFDQGNIESFLFCAVELKDRDYSRTKYAEFTREINKRFSVPTVVFFRVESCLTVGFADRRPSKVDAELNVLGQVTLIKDIRLNNPHRAHLEILSELSLEERLQWMNDNDKEQNFDGLLAAWLEKLDTEELNKQFYRKLFAWYEWAVLDAKFPTDKKRKLKPEEHVMRLITRLLFIWFIKEKGLIAESLFNEARVRELLKEDDFEGGDSYYRVVLQNLFFATLNTKIDERGFSRENDSDHRNFYVYRYRSQMRDPDKLLALFAQTPFINGGLFDCLDSFKGERAGGYRVDCFSDRHYKKLSMPNRLFFDKNKGLLSLLEHYKFTVEENTPIDQEVALDPELLGRTFENLLAAYNPETGATARKQTGSYYTPRAIVDYMVAETLVATLSEKSAPTDGDLTLWTERLHYLLDYAQACDDASDWFDQDETEAIVKAISELKVLDPAAGSGAFPMGVLHKLTLALRRLDPDNTQWEQLQRELAAQKAEAAFDTQDQEDRDAKLIEISDVFERYRDSDFGRKLYLIQNSIFGVDIQPVACQIAKLRFFISLAIEQVVDEDADNFSIKPLPNLETRFVAADTLIGLDISKTRELLQTDTVQHLLKEIETIREQYFFENNRQRKLKLEVMEDEYREKLQAELERLRAAWIAEQEKAIETKVAQLSTAKQRKEVRKEEEAEYRECKAKFDANFDDARKIAEWKPYDQNSNADWFDPEYMFRISGFDVVVGNPPYIQLQDDESRLGKLYEGCNFESFAKTGDIYCLFYEKANQLSRNDGYTCFITSNKWMRAGYGKKLRNYFTTHVQPIQLLDMGPDVFDSAADTNILLFQNSVSDTPNAFSAVTIGVDFDKQHDDLFQYLSDNATSMELPTESAPWVILTATESALIRKIESVGKVLKDWNVNIYRGVVTGCNEAFIIDGVKREELIAQDPRSGEIIKPLLRGRDMKRYCADQSELYLLATDYNLNIPQQYPAIYNHLETIGIQIELGELKTKGKGLFDRKDQGTNWYNLRSCAYYSEFEKERVVWGNIAYNSSFCYSKPGEFVSAPANLLTSESNNIKYLLGCMNSKVFNWLFVNLGVTLGRAFEWKKQYIELIHVPPVTDENREICEKIENLVDQILASKTEDSNFDSTEIETEIDNLVYALYGLTKAEIAMVEGTAE